MSINLHEISLVLGPLLSDFASIHAELTLEQKLRFFAETLQKHTGLCYVMVKRIENGWIVFDSLFTHSKEHYQIFMDRSPKRWELAANAFVAQAVSSGKVICDSLDEKPHPFFIGWDLPAVSEVLIPIVKSGKVIGVIELGSEELIPREVRKDKSLLQQAMNPFEMLSKKISQSLDSAA